MSGQDSQAKFLADRFFGRSAKPFEGPLANVMITLALSVVDVANAGRLEDDDWRAVEAWGALAPLAARTLADIHVRFPGAATGARERWRTRLDTLVPASGRKFLEVVPIKPPWDRALDRLQGFLAPPPVAKAETTARARRLVFRLDATTMDIEPVEQTAKGHDWSPGRSISIKRLHQGDPKIDYLTSEDHAVLKTISLDRTY